MNLSPALPLEPSLIFRETLIKSATPISNGGLILTAPRYSTSSAPGAGSQPLFLLVAARGGYLEDFYLPALSFSSCSLM